MVKQSVDRLITQITEKISQQITSLNLTISETDLSRPWGGYLRISDTSISTFLANFFADFQLPDWTKSLRMDPKILIIKPSTRLSWQYHDRRGEIWNVIEGPVGVMTSTTDTQPSEPNIFQKGNVIEISQGTRHRLIGLDNWGIVAEIWISTNPSIPTDESDNHRLADDYGRS